MKTMTVMYATWKLISLPNKKPAIEAVKLEFLCFYTVRKFCFCFLLFFFFFFFFALNEQGKNGEYIL